MLQFRLFTPTDLMENSDPNMKDRGSVSLKDKGTFHNFQITVSLKAWRFFANVCFHDLQDNARRFEIPSSKLKKKMQFVDWPLGVSSKRQSISTDPCVTMSIFTAEVNRLFRLIDNTKSPIGYMFIKCNLIEFIGIIRSNKCACVPVPLLFGILVPFLIKTFTLS